MKTFVAVCLIISTMITAGCAVSRMLTDKPGKDVSSIRPGSERPMVQLLLGKPLREWSTTAAIHYCVYAYDGGYQASASEASAVLFIDIIGAGLPELFVALDPETFKPAHEIRQMAVAYDSNDKVVGVFDDFSDFNELPANGVPSEKMTVPVP